MRQTNMGCSVHRTLVTGGAGFIGSHLVERLLANGDAVTVLDNFSTGRMAYLDEVKDNPRLSIHHVDVSGFADIKPFFEGIDWVFHLAALADIVPSIQQPVTYHKANVDGTIAVLEAARSVGIRRFVYAASSSCYGIPDEFPTLETAPIRPMYPYALTKYLGEQYVLHWNRVYKLPCVSLRLFNVYGPRARTSGAYGAVFWHRSWLESRSRWWEMGIRQGTSLSSRMWLMPLCRRRNLRPRARYSTSGRATHIASTVW